MADRIAFGLLVVVLVTAATTDWRSGKIYNWLTIPAMAVGLAYWTIWGFMTHGSEGAWDGGLRALVGLGAGLLPFVVLVALGGMGGGDAKLIGAIGALWGDWQCVLTTAFYGFLVGAVAALWIMLRHRLVRRTFERLFTVMAFLVARQRPTVPADSPRIPLGVAFCLGGLAAGLEHLRVLRLPWTP